MISMDSPISSNNSSTTGSSTINISGRSSTRVVLQPGVPPPTAVPFLQLPPRQHSNHHHQQQQQQQNQQQSYLAVHHQHATMGLSSSSSSLFVPVHPLPFPNPMVHRSYSLRYNQNVHIAAHSSYHHISHTTCNNVTVLCRKRSVRTMSSSVSSSSAAAAPPTTATIERAYWIKEQIGGGGEGSSIYLGVVVVPRNHDTLNTNNNKSSNEDDDDDWITTANATITATTTTTTTHSDNYEMVLIQVSSLSSSFTTKNHNLYNNGPLSEAACLQLIGNYHTNIMGCIEVLQDDINNVLYTILPYHHHHHHHGGTGSCDAAVVEDGTATTTTMTTLESYLRRQQQQNSHWNPTRTTFTTNPIVRGRNIPKRIDPNSCILSSNITLPPTFGIGNWMINVTASDVVPTTLSSDCSSTARTVSTDGTFLTNDDTASIATTTGSMFTVYEDDDDSNRCNVDSAPTRQYNNNNNSSNHETNVRELFLQLIEALLHLQRKGVCHRNINPSNVLIVESDHGHNCFCCCNNNNNNNSSNNSHHRPRLILMDFTCAVRIPYNDDSNLGGIADVSQGSNRLLIRNNNNTTGGCYPPPPPIRTRRENNHSTIKLEDVGHGVTTRVNNSRSPRVRRYHSTSSSLSSTSNRYKSSSLATGTGSTSSSLHTPSNTHVHKPPQQQQALQPSPFLAPELVEGQPYDGYTVDLWSAGVLLYVMLTGTVPFHTPDVKRDVQYRQINLGKLKQSMQQHHQQRIMNNCYTRSANGSQYLSDEAIDLLQNIFWYDPRKRLTLQDVIMHPWITASHKCNK